MGSSRYAQLMQDADNKSAQGDFERAINLYEAALDDSESTRNAEVHYKLAVLYDDKLNDPVSALHHFKRYLALSPNGTHANEVKNSIKHDEVAALTALSGDSVIARSEVARLQNENLNLRKELETRAARVGRNGRDQERDLGAALQAARQTDPVGRIDGHLVLERVGVRTLLFQPVEEKLARPDQLSPRCSKVVRQWVARVEIARDRHVD